MTSTPILQLVGGLYTDGPDRFIDFLMETFPRLSEEVPHIGEIARYVIYESDEGTDEAMRFVGIQVACIKEVPRGMVAWELGEDSWTISETRDGRKSVICEGDLSWRWLDRAAPGWPIGEFTAECPPEWRSGAGSASREFRVYANSYFTPGQTRDDGIYLVDYDPTWPMRYQEMAVRLREALGPDIALRIEHFGSTSIPGMPAKPVIDILVEVPSFDEARRRTLPYFNRPECEYWSYSGHMTFILRDEITGPRTHHIHMAPAGHDLWKGLAFRDYLRTHPGDASRYASLKHTLASQHSSDREAYTSAKSEFIQEIAGKIKSEK